MKIRKIVVLILLFLYAFIITSFAHSGRTDSNGGHYDRSTGEYHYHNGGSSSQNSNSSWKDQLPSNCPNCSASINSENGIYCFECGYKTISTSAIILTDGPENKTRSEYFNEVMALEDENESLSKEISAYKKILSKNGYQSIEDILKEKENLSNKINNMWIIFIFILIISISIAYNTGKKRVNN